MKGLKDAFLLTGAATHGVKECKSDYIPVMCYPVFDGDLCLGYYPISQVFPTREAVESVIVDRSVWEEKLDE